MLILTDENFEKEILASPKPILVDFYTFWCAPCQVFTPILEKLAEKFNEKITFAKANLDTAPLTAQKYGIDRMPTVILFNGGKPMSGFVGVRSEDEVRKWLEENLKNETEKIEKIIQEVEEYARKSGFKLNPDRKVVEGIVKSLLEREKKFGARYCPCRRITENQEEDKKIICPCVFHQMEIERDGHCLCGLFVK